MGRFYNKHTGCRDLRGKLPKSMSHKRNCLWIFKGFSAATCDDYSSALTVVKADELHLETHYISPQLLSQSNIRLPYRDPGPDPEATYEYFRFQGKSSFERRTSPIVIVFFIGIMPLGLRCV